MITNWMWNIEVDILTLLEDGVKMLFYVWEYDLFFNYLGYSIWVNYMNWFGSEILKKSLQNISLKMIMKQVYNQFWTTRFYQGS